MIHCKEKLSLSNLTDLFYQGCKEEELLGLEYERLPINKTDQSTIS